jgi:hypothetical protein
MMKNDPPPMQPTLLLVLGSQLLCHRRSLPAMTMILRGLVET